MIQFASEWILQTIAMALTALILPHLKITSIFGALGAVLGLALLNSTIWDAALFFSLPNTFSVQTMVLLLSNGLFFFLLVKFLPGIEVDSVLIAFIAPVIFTIICVVIKTYGHLIDWAALMAYFGGVISSLKGYLQPSS
jgi:putative membrane protein